MKKKIILFLICIAIVYSCIPKKNNTEKQINIDNNSINEYKFEKVEIVNNELSYYDIEPKIDDLGEFLSMYTDEELFTVNFLELTLNEIIEIEGLERLPNLEILILASNRIERIEGISHLSQLRKLSLYQNKISVIENLDNLVNLKDLNLASNQLQDISGLLVLKNMEVVNIKGYNDLNDEYFDICNQFKENNPNLLEWQY